MIVGDQNADPLDGDSVDAAINQLLDNSLIQTRFRPRPARSRRPRSRAVRTRPTKATRAYDTADFSDTAPGNLRADYVLPSRKLSVVDAGVFWPVTEDPLWRLTGAFPFPSSDHRLVWVDLVPRTGR